MRDNKPIEKQAENYLKSQLSKFDFNYQEPSYDKNGSDLTIIENIKAKKTKLLNVQSKGRTISSTSTNVKIPKKYLNEEFILFIYTVDENKNDNLFMFLHSEIKQWKLNSKGEFTLSFNKNSIEEKYFQEKSFDILKAKELKKILEHIEIKDYTTILIDGVFLEKAIKTTIATYSGIWKEKKFLKPNINTVVKNILDSYDKFKTKSNTINCFLITSEHFALEEHISFDCPLSFKTKENGTANIFITKSDSIVAFDIIEQIERLINNDNIILVADDITYEQKMKDYKELGVDIIIVQLNEHQGREIHSGFRWGDVEYPLGLAIGLERTEL
jgi:hypothetical protein